MPNPTPKSSSRDLLRDAMAFITQNEGLKNQVYPDSAGHPTVGIGHRLTDRELAERKVGGIDLIPTDKKPGWRLAQPLPQKAIQTLFKADTQEAMAAAHNLLPEGASHNTLVGLTDFFFQMGPNIAADPSSRNLRAALASGNPSELVDTMLLFTKDRDPATNRLRVNSGLVERAERRASLIATPDDTPGLQEMLPGLDAAFDAGRVGAASLQERLGQDPSIRRTFGELTQPARSGTDLIRHVK